MNKEEVTLYYNDLALAGKKLRNDEDEDEGDCDEDLVGNEGAK